jgi:hypothetical protein
MEYIDMTDEEYAALDEELTRTVPKLGPNGSGWLSQREKCPWGYSEKTVKYLLDKAKELHKSPAQIIDELVLKDMAVASM